MFYTPNVTDLLMVPTIQYSLNKTSSDCLDLPYVDSVDYLIQNNTGSPRGVIRPDFVYNETKPIFVTEEGAAAYKKIYDKIY